MNRSRCQTLEKVAAHYLRDLLDRATHEEKNMATAVR